MAGPPSTTSSLDGAESTRATVAQHSDKQGESLTEGLVVRQKLGQLLGESWHVMLLNLGLLQPKDVRLLPRDQSRQSLVG